MADNVEGDENGGGGLEEIFATNPNEWSDNQTIGVAIGGSFAFVILLVLLWSFHKAFKWCSRKWNKGTVNPRHTLTKPYVLRRAARTSQHFVNSSDKLPLGCKVHGAEKLHAAGLDGQGVRVAVIDTGIDKQHPGFEGRVVKQEWYRSGTPLVIDDHGTHVAGTIHFMAPKANIYDYRVTGKEGEINSDRAVAESIRDAVAEGCHIINISIRISYPVLKDIRKAVKYAYRKGVIIVCATGNYPGDDDPTINNRLTYPAKWNWTISVAAVKKVLGAPVASFSDVKVGAKAGHRIVDFAAVGQEVVSLKPGGGYQVMSGTSVAAPHVTGTIAAMMTGGGDVKKRAKRLLAELKSTYAMDVAAKGSDNNTTNIVVPTFLTKWEYDKCWRLYASGFLTSTTNEQPSLEQRESSRSVLSAERDSRRNLMKGTRNSSRNVDCENSPPQNGPRPNLMKGTSFSFRNVTSEKSNPQNGSSRSVLSAERDSRRNLMKGTSFSFRNVTSEKPKPQNGSSRSVLSAERDSRRNLMKGTSFSFRNATSEKSQPQNGSRRNLMKGTSFSFRNVISEKSNPQSGSSRSVLSAERDSRRNLMKGTSFSSRNVTSEKSHPQSGSSRSVLLAERDSRRNLMKGTSFSSRNVTSEKSKPQKESRRNLMKGTSFSSRNVISEKLQPSPPQSPPTGARASFRNSRKNVSRSTLSTGSSSPSSVQKLPKRLSGNGRPVLSRREDSSNSRESFRDTFINNTGRSSASVTYVPRRLSGNGRPVLSLERSSNAVNSNRKAPEKGRQRSRSGSLPLSSRQRVSSTSRQIPRQGRRDSH